MSWMGGRINTRQAMATAERPKPAKPRTQPARKTAPPHMVHSQPVRLANRVGSDKRLPVRKDLRPVFDLNGFAQPRWPERFGFHQLPRLINRRDVDQPEAAFDRAVWDFEWASGFDDLAIFAQKREVLRHELGADVRVRVWVVFKMDCEKPGGLRFGHAQHHAAKAHSQCA